jgi:hypothetical protein
MNSAVRFLIVVFLLVKSCMAQSPDGTISGIVQDASERPIADAEIIIVNDATNVQYPSKTNEEGIYVAPNLPPGSYRIQVTKRGFKTLVKPGLVLNVQGALSVSLTLPVGAVTEVVTVEAGSPSMNTTDATISTVVDSNFVANMPLNGRSFQDLILLTPGVVTNSPQTPSYAGERGEFSVNGQRTESNYYSVDGVSGNIGIFPSSISFPSSGGSLPSSTTLGTTQGLVSVDALEEFRVQSSTYSAEFGRYPGGQFGFVTRSGTNQWHGTAFEYLRNSFFDANDWFNDYYGVPESALRQNDFGGTLGGPIRIPHVYDGKDRTFFFVSYEGLRLTQPQAASISYVPTVALRNSAPAELQPVLNAFPLPYCPAGSLNCTEDLGNGFGEFVGSWSNPSSIDATSFRVDHVVNDKVRLFFRFSDTGSTSSARAEDPAQAGASTFTTRTYTAGATIWALNNLSNELRVNYSSNEGSFTNVVGSFAGSQAINLVELQSIDLASSPAAQVVVSFPLGSYSTEVFQSVVSGKQRQWNVVDTATLLHGKHEMKFGVDFRRLLPRQQPTSPSVSYDYFSESSILANTVDFGSAQTALAAKPIYTNFSAFAQDAWHVTARLVLSFGLRWEVNPAPSAAAGNLPYTAEGSSLGALVLAPEGTRLWKTTWYNLAPRFGAAYILRNEPGYETVIRAGGGVFFDTGQQLGSSGYNGPGFSAVTRYGDFLGVNASFPLPLSEVTPEIVVPPVAPYSSTVYAFSPHLQLPYTLQWSTSIEQALGKAQSVSVAYVGANGRRLLEQQQVAAASFNPSFSTIIFGENGLTSDYDALQIQFQRRVKEGLAVLASYTFSHAIDYGSQNTALPYIRGNADFDVRHNFSAALVYDVPFSGKNALERVLLSDWGADARLSLRSGFPVTLNGIQRVNPATGQNYYSGLDLVSNQPIYISGSQCTDLYGTPCPGGRAINPNAFALPASGEPGDAPRNFVRGFGAWQTDFAVRREFPISERLKLQFRAEAFNIFNHPNFGTINATYCSPSANPFCTFGEAEATLAQSLGVLSPLYQMGGARSLQFSLRLKF